MINGMILAPKLDRHEARIGSAERQRQRYRVDKRIAVEVVQQSHIAVSVLLSAAEEALAGRVAQRYRAAIQMRQLRQSG
jgi:hypothetical protein